MKWILFFSITVSFNYALTGSRVERTPAEQGMHISCAGELAGEQSNANGRAAIDYIRNLVLFRGTLLTGSQAKSVFNSLLLYPGGTTIGNVLVYQNELAMLEKIFPDSSFENLHFLVRRLQDISRQRKVKRQVLQDMRELSLGITPSHFAFEGSVGEHFELFKKLMQLKSFSKGSNEQMIKTVHSILKSAGQRVPIHFVSMNIEAMIDVHRFNLFFKDSNIVVFRSQQERMELFEAMQRQSSENSLSFFELLKMITTMYEQRGGPILASTLIQFYTIEIPNEFNAFESLGELVGDNVRAESNSETESDNVEDVRQQVTLH